PGWPAGVHWRRAGRDARPTRGRGPRQGPGGARTCGQGPDLGALTASVAHEVNQPLSGIITNASTCLRMLAADPPNVDGARETAKRTIRNGHRTAEVIAHVRSLFVKKDAAIEALDLNDATRAVI